MELLEARAAEVVATLATDGTLEAAGLEAIEATDMLRSDIVTDAPIGLLAAVFEMEVGETRVLPGTDSAAIVTLDAITPAAQDEEQAALLEELNTQLNQTLAQDLFNIYADDVVRRAGPQIDQRALQAVHVNFP